MEIGTSDGPVRGLQRPKEPWEEPSKGETTYNPNKRLARLSGWRFGAWLSAVCAGIAFLVNFVVMVWATVTTRPFIDGNGGIGTLYEGDCNRARTINLWSHLAINALSTLLLGASNYTQQTLLAPTREEVDKAHQKNKVVNIGTASSRNTNLIAPSRIWLWLLLSLSSIPLHFLYNSCIFTTLSGTFYPVNVTTPAMLESSSSFKNGNWTNLSNSECISQFQRPLVLDWAEVLVVVDNTANETLISQSNPIKPGSLSGNDDPLLSFEHSWMCQDLSLCTYTLGPSLKACQKSQCSLDPSSWRIGVGGQARVRNATLYSAQSCYARPAAGHCKVQFIPSILIVVMVCNVVKMICMSASFMRKEWNRSLVTIGDAIESFLDRPDPLTVNLSLYHAKPWRWKPPKKGTDFEHSQRWTATRNMWFSAVSVRIWVLTHILYAATMIIAAILLWQGITHVAGIESTSVKGLWKTGFGVADYNALLNIVGNYNSPLISMALLANSPQVLLSGLYLFYNGIFTRMLLEREWNSLGVKRQALRVSNKKGKQLSTHFLSLPKLYAIPLMIFFALLHWMLSQALFLVRIDFYDSSGSFDSSAKISTCGWSNIAIIGAIVVGSVGILVKLANGFKRYRPGIPLAAGCSAVISAACHRPDQDVNAARKMVKWGVRHCGGSGYVVRDSPSVYCCITSLKVDEPTEGMLSA